MVRGIEVPRRSSSPGWLAALGLIAVALLSACGSTHHLQVRGEGLVGLRAMFVIVGRTADFDGDKVNTRVEDLTEQERQKDYRVFIQYRPVGEPVALWQEQLRNKNADAQTAISVACEETEPVVKLSIEQSLLKADPTLEVAIVTYHATRGWKCQHFDHATLESSPKLAVRVLDGNIELAAK